MKLLAILPVRSGSKSIPNKNIAELNGSHLLSYVINAAKNITEIDDFVVTSDSNKYLEIAKLYYSDLILRNRPKNLSDDFTGSGEVIKHCIKFLKKKYKLKYICCVYPCNPFLNLKDLKNGLKKMINEKNKFIFSATEYQFPFFRSFVFSKKSGCSMIFKNFYKSRSQDLKKILCDAGQFYWGTDKSGMLNKSIYTKNSNFILIPKWRYCDIDTLEDWKRAENLVKILKK